MSSVCTIEPRVNPHLSSHSNEKFLGQEFRATVGCTNGGYKTKSDENFTKATRKRNKKRANKEIVLNHQTDAALGSGDWNRTGLENYNECEKSVDEIIDGTNVIDQYVEPDCGKGSEVLIKVASSSSYAAVVSGRNGRDLIKSDYINAVLEIEDFAPLVNSSAMSIFGPNSSSSNPSGNVSTKDVGVQVNIEVATAIEKSPGISRSQGTMTSRKGRYRNKFVSVKTCCTNDDLTISHPKTPAVQFLGNDLTFQNVLAKTAAQLGIRFMDGMEDDDFQI